MAYDQPLQPAGPQRWIAWAVAVVALVGAGFAVALGHAHTFDNRPMQTITVVVISLWFTPDRRSARPGRRRQLGR